MTDVSTLHSPTDAPLRDARGAPPSTPPTPTPPGGGARGDLPDLPPLVGRRRRRRHRRPARHHRAAALPARRSASTPSGSRPSTPPAGRRRLRRRRLPRHRPALRHPRRRRRDGRARPTSSASRSSSTSSPTTPPTSTSGSRPRWPPAPGSPERARYIFRDGKGEHGELPPNNWHSRLRRRRLDPHHRGRRHPRPVVPAPVRHQAARLRLGQPRGAAPSSRTILRFWLDRGIDGFRVDVAHGLVKEQGLPDWATRSCTLLDGERRSPAPAQAPRCGTRTASTRSTARWRTGSLDDVRHDRPTASCAPRRGSRPQERAVALRAPATRCTRRSTSTSCRRRGWRRRPARGHRVLAARPPTPSAPRRTWVLSNHDVVRHASRLGLPVGTPPAQRHRRRRPAARPRRSACGAPAPRPR